VKVILIQDVNKLGNKGDLVEVSDGYARNFLFRRGLAVEGTGGRLKEWEEQQKARQNREARQEQAALEMKKRIGGKRVLVRMSAGEEGKLFGSVTSAQVAAAIKEQHGAEVERKDIRFDEQIKQLGSYPFKIRLHAGVEVELALSVEAE
jgi:large subunit ribosomal protein L9